MIKWPLPSTVIYHYISTTTYFFLRNALMISWIRKWSISLGCFWFVSHMFLSHPWHLGVLWKSGGEKNKITHTFPWLLLLALSISPLLYIKKQCVTKLSIEQFAYRQCNRLWLEKLFLHVQCSLKQACATATLLHSTKQSSVQLRLKKVLITTFCGL